MPKQHSIEPSKSGVVLITCPCWSNSLGNLNSFFIYAGDYERALQNSEQARAIADRIDNRWAQAFSLFLVEMIHAERGEIEKAISFAKNKSGWAVKLSLPDPGGLTATPFRPGC